MNPGSLKQSLKNDLIYVLIRALLAVLGLLPRPLVRKVFRVLGGIAYYAAARERKTAYRNITHAFPDKGPAAVRRMVKRVFIEIALNFSEVLYIRSMDAASVDRTITACGLEHARRAFAEGRGVIFLSGHVGCFEMLSIYLSLKGFPMTVLGTRLYDPRLDRLLVENRKQHAVSYVERGRNTVDILRVLRRGEAFGVLFDLDTRVQGVFAPFFGRPAFTPAGPMRIALKYDIPVVPIVIQREKDFHHRVTALPRVSVERTGDDETDLRAFAGECNRRLEELIMRAPEQWIWIHDRWKTRPPDETEKEQ